jgi:hypothetical protein
VAAGVAHPGPPDRAGRHGAAVDLGLAIVDQTEGATSSAAGHCRAILERWRQTEDRHYAIAPLRWATTFFSEAGDGDGTRTCAAALAQIAADAGQDEAMSALAHGLGETALLDGGAEQAADQFARALALLQGIDAPSTGPSPSAAPAPPWPCAAGARRRSSTWSPPTARPDGSGPGR